MIRFNLGGKQLILGAIKSIITVSRGRVTWRLAVGGWQFERRPFSHSALESVGAGVADAQAAVATL